MAIIALLWVRPYYAAKAIAPATNPTLRIISLNTWRGNVDLTAVKEWMRGIDADVVALQEVVIDNLTDGELPDLKGLYPYQHSQYVPEGWWGNVTLSRYPILRVDNLPNDPGDTFTTQQRFELDMNGETIAIYNVHFARPLTPKARPRIMIPIPNFFIQGALTYDAGLRNSQIQKFLSQIQYEKYPYIVAGDFNMSDSTQMYGEIAARLKDSFMEAGYGLGGSWPLGEAEGFLPRSFPPLLRFDYIWHNDGFRTVQIAQGPRHLGSDHLPLYATLELMP
jgi:endonuclease/exonuclease/phosphatase family metal-dependent hydrolase